MRHTYYSVDIEATGPVPGLYNMVSLGATAIHPVQGSSDWTVGQSFYVELRPSFAGSQAQANEIHGLDLERLALDGLEPRAAMTSLTDFVEQTCTPGTTPVFVGHVAVFDWMYVCWYYAWCGLKNPFGYKGIDTKSLAMGALQLGWEQTSRENLSTVLEIPQQSEETLHRADADAKHQAQLFVAIMRRLQIS